jgi:hypothetical protein
MMSGVASGCGLRVQEVRPQTVDLDAVVRESGKASSIVSQTERGSPVVQQITYETHWSADRPIVYGLIHRVSRCLDTSEEPGFEGVVESRVEGLHLTRA